MNFELSQSELGPFIKTAREQRAMTIRQAEKLSGISNAYLNQIENGKVKNPSPGILNKLSQLYQIPYEMLLIKSRYPLPDFSNNLKRKIIGTIIIIDDSPNDRELIKTYLNNDKSYNYNIYEAETGVKALEILSKISPDCIILDYLLPDMDGLILFEEIKKRDKLKNASVIVMTGYGNEKIAVKAISMGAINYITKENINDDIIIRTVQYGVQRKLIIEERHKSYNDKIILSDETLSEIIELGSQMRGAIERIIILNESLRLNPDFIIFIEKSIELENRYIEIQIARGK